MTNASKAALLTVVAAVSACDSDSVHVESPARVVGASASRTSTAAPGWRAQVLYLVMTDRFRNGDLENDDAGSPGCHDADDPQQFHGGDLEGLRQNLDYVREVGATAIWVTPTYRPIGRLPNHRCGYHGYWADNVEPYDDALEPKLGTPADLTRLIADMHGGGMRFILDMVVNHTGDIARLPRQKPDWFHDPRSCGALGDATVYCPLDAHPDFKQERADTAAYLSDVAARWASKYALDGIRMDTAKHVPKSYFTSSFLPAVRGIRPPLFTVAEAFDEGSIDPGARYVDAGFDQLVDPSRTHHELHVGDVAFEPSHADFAAVHLDHSRSKKRRHRKHHRLRHRALRAHGGSPAGGDEHPRSPIDQVPFGSNLDLGETGVDRKQKRRRLGFDKDAGDGFAATLYEKPDTHRTTRVVDGRGRLRARLSAARTAQIVDPNVAKPITLGPHGRNQRTTERSFQRDTPSVREPWFRHGDELRHVRNAHLRQLERSVGSGRCHAK